MSDVTMKASARFSNLVARFPALGRSATARQVDSYQQFTERRIPVAVLERRAG